MKINQIKDVEVKKEGDSYNVIIDLSKCKFLYRYRACNKNTLDAFEKDQLWMSSPLKFNDPYDVSLSYSKKEIRDYVKKKVADLTKLTKLNEKNVFGFVFGQIDKIVEGLIGNLKSTYHIACFCTNINDEVMWAHYADCGRGFALRYDVDDFYYKQKLPDFKGVFPVVYTQNKASANGILKIVVDKICGDLIKKHNNNDEDVYFDPDISRDEWAEMSLQSLLFKKRSWKYENEYRLIADNRNPELFYKCYENVKPKAIYLGEFMPNNEKTKLIELAVAKGIDFYVMKSNYSRSKNCLEGIKLKIIHNK